MAWICGRSPGDAETQLKERRRLDEPAGYELLREADVPELEHFELRSHAERPDVRRHLLEVRRRVHEDARTEVHRAAVEAAERRTQRLDVGQPQERWHEIAAGAGA